MIKAKIYLVSKSPRRKELLQEMGFDFEVVTVDIEEKYPSNLPPIEIAEFLSKLKLSTINFYDYQEDAVFISCDTIVVLGNEILEKPIDSKDAKRMLQLLSGKTHQVISGLTVASAKTSSTTHSITDVTFKTFFDDEIDFYIKNYKPFDKAGAYGIQEWIGLMGVTKINGCFYNVMGLPTQLLYEILQTIIPSPSF